ncbi:MAG: hypothetical protein V2A58_14120 [Planctomycetota bacterium]
MLPSCLRAFVAIPLLACASACAQAPDSSFGELHGPRLRVYAPAWVWQGIPASVIVILEHSEPQTQTYVVSLQPDRGSSLFDLPDPATLTVTAELPPHGEARVIFSDLVARRGENLGSASFFLSIDGEEAKNILIKTVRGPAFIAKRPSLAALLAVSLAWCVVCAIVLFRISPPGAWRETQTFSAPGNLPPWAKDDQP